MEVFNQTVDLKQAHVRENINNYHERHFPLEQDAKDWSGCIGDRDEKIGRKIGYREHEYIKK